MPGSYGFLYRNSIFLLVGTNERITDFQVTMDPVLSEMRKYTLIAGISNTFSSVLQMRHGYQARKAIELGRVLRKDEPIYRYSDYSIYHMMELSLAGTELENFCQPELITLMQYCKENGGELLETLQAFLKCGRNKAQTAKALDVHLNTVKYRLTQISHITKLDLDIDDNALKMMLSFKMLEFREHFPVLEPLDLG